MSEPTAITEHKPADPHAHGAAEEHGHGEHHGSLFEHAKPYLVVGFLLFLFTAITVGLSYVDFAHKAIFSWGFGLFGIHGHAINFVIGMIVATFKVCLVGAWFMHLKNEGANIWRPLLFTFFFVTGLFLLCLLAYLDPIPTTVHWHH